MRDQVAAKEQADAECSAWSRIDGYKHDANAFISHWGERLLSNRFGDVAAGVSSLGAFGGKAVGQTLDGLTMLFDGGQSGRPAAPTACAGPAAARRSP